MELRSQKGSDVFHIYITRIYILYIYIHLYYSLIVKDDLLGCLPLSLAPSLGAFPLKLGACVQRLGCEWEWGMVPSGYIR